MEAAEDTRPDVTPEPDAPDAGSEATTQAALSRMRAQRSAAAQDRTMDASADAEMDPAATIRHAAQGGKLDDQQVVDATDWFMSADDADYHKTLRLNVGGPVDEEGAPLDAKRPPKWMTWTVRPLDSDVIQAIRRRSRQAQQNRRARRNPNAQAEGPVDDALFNLGVVVEGSVDPDLRAIAEQQNIADPREVLKARLRTKSGLIGQIVGEILDLSGFNENDVQDADAADPAPAAGGN